MSQTNKGRGQRLLLITGLTLTGACASDSFGTEVTTNPPVPEWEDYADCVQVSPDQVDLGTLTLTDDPQESVTEIEVTNACQVPIDLNRMSLPMGGVDEPPWQLRAPEPAEIPPVSSGTFEVVFTPTEAGAFASDVLCETDQETVFELALTAKVIEAE